MTYIVQGLNPNTNQWETLPYQTEDMQIHHEYTVEYIAVCAMKAMGELWGGEYRVIRSSQATSNPKNG